MFVKLFANKKEVIIIYFQAKHGKKEQRRQLTPSFMSSVGCERLYFTGCGGWRVQCTQAPVHIATGSGRSKRGEWGTRTGYIHTDNNESLG